MCFLSQLMYHILHKAQGTDKSAQQSSQKQDTDNKAARKPEDLIHGRSGQHIRVAEQVAARARALIQIVGTG